MSRTTDFGVVIGIQYYKESMDPLNGPHDDVDRFVKWLIHPAGGFVPEKNLGIFISTPTYTPTQDDIDTWFEQLLGQLQQNGAIARRLYFYFSGHGIGVTALNSAMLLPKWSNLLRNYALSSEKYLLELVNKGLFQEIFFFMDCCRNRIPGVLGQPPMWASPAPSANACEYMMYYATEFANAAFEAQLGSPNTTLDNLLPRGLFTKVLLDGLNGAAADRKGILRVQDLVTYVKKQLPQLAASKGKTQIPRPNIAIDLEKEIIGPFPAEIEITIEFQIPGMNLVLEDPDLRIVNEDSSDKTWTIKLKRGEHTLRKKNETTGQMIIVDGLQNKFIYG
jgi:hypothetical protein